MRLLFLAIAALSWILGLLVVDWRHWRHGYATALLAALGALLLTAADSRPGGFWAYTSAALPWLWPNITLALGLYPVGAWIFNQRYPAGPWWVQVSWFLFGDIALLSVEGLLLVSGRMHYYHGWTFGLSTAVNLLLLALLRVHHVAVERAPERRRQPRGLRL